MFKKVLNSKSILLISVVVAVAGLASDFIPGGPDNMVATGIRFLLSSVDLYPKSYLNNVLNFQWANYALYAMLLLGAIIYAISKQKETRLIRFVFSTIFISNVVILIWYVTFTLYSSRHYSNLAVDIPLAILFRLITLAWLYLAYLVLKSFEYTTSLEVQTTQYGAEIAPVLCSANLWQRLFHTIIDSVIIGLIIYAKIQVLMLTPGFKQLIISMERLIGPKPSLILIIFIIRTLYYLCFEGIFGSTPAKYLTHTRVINDDGEKPAFKAVLIRTLYRSVPFNSVSFLTGSGWHDRWSGTTVVREKSEGVNGGWYFMIPFAVAILAAITLTARTTYEQHLARKADNESRDKQYELFDEQLKNLTTNDFIELNNAAYYESDKLVYLKTEQIKADSIQFSALFGTGDNDNPQLMVEKLYRQDTGNLQRVWFSKKQLRRAFKAKGMYSDEVQGLPLRSEQYAVISIQEFFAPNIRMDETSPAGGKMFEINLRNIGWSADVTDIRPLSEGMKINTMVPIHVAAYNNYPQANFRISGQMDDSGQSSLQFTIKDSTGRQQIYTASNLQNFGTRSLTRIK
jgi:uncharacterized RDD family membrane protein YckC